MHPLCRALLTPRLVFRSVIGGHFCTTLLGLGACSCRTRTRAWLPCLAHTLCCCCIGVPLPWLYISMAWLGMARCWAHTCRLRLCLLHSFLQVYSPTYSVVREQQGSSPRFAPALAPQLRRISIVERQHKPLHALGPLDAACTVHRPEPSGHGAHATRALREPVARVAGVFLCDGVQREHRSLEHCFDDNDRQRMRPFPSNACAACVPWLGMRHCVAYMPSAAADRGCSHACFCRASLILPCFTHFSSIPCALLDSTASLSGLPSSNCRSCAASRPSSASSSLRTHSARWTLRAPSVTDRRGSGLMRRVLFESVWHGSQAFYYASVFNADIGAWNTASMTTMDSVCAHWVPCKA